MTTRSKLDSNGTRGWGEGHRAQPSTIFLRCDAMLCEIREYRNNGRDEKKGGEGTLGCTINRQFSHFLQDALDLCVELASGVVVSHAVFEIALHARELLVALLCELALHPDHRLKARIKVGHALLEQDWDLAHELVVE